MLEAIIGFIFVAYLVNFLVEVLFDINIAERLKDHWNL